MGQYGQACSGAAYLDEGLGGPHISDAIGELTGYGWNALGVNSVSRDPCAGWCCGDHAYACDADQLKFVCFAQQASPGALQLTGVLGLAAFLFGLYHLRGGGASLSTSCGMLLLLSLRLDLLALLARLMWSAPSPARRPKQARR